MSDHLNLFPKIDPYRTAYLNVSGGHELYFEECGSPDGKPVVVLHGGPGAGCNETLRRFFDPKRYRIVLFDQRGAGRSRPHANLEANTTWDLVDDIEKLRAHLNIQKWQVFGGSWGSTLALAYATEHPDRVTELVLRGIFLLRDQELHWFYQEGASRIFPEAFEVFKNHIPKEEQGDLLSAYSKRLLDGNKQTQLAAAKAWTLWELSTSELRPSEDYKKAAESDEFSLAFARIENHYFMNKGFFQKSGALLDRVDKIKGIPGVIVHGRYDVVCPVENAWDLSKRWSDAKLIITPSSGHSVMEAETRSALIEATNRFASG